MKPFLFITLMALPVVGSAHPFEKLYGDQITFDVVRNDKVIGQYRTRFTNTPEGWRTDVQMDLELSVLLFWNYRYQYKASEVWQAGQLNALQVQVDDNGDLTRFDYSRRGDELVSADGQQTIALPVLPTHHFNAAVLQESRVLNTLVGRDHPVTIEKAGTETLTINGQPRPATHYRYTQVLKGTEAWYDEAGRWVQLRFPDKRGTAITLRCTQCGPSTSHTAQHLPD